MVKKQKTFSLPEDVSAGLDSFLLENKVALKKLGITNRTQLLVALLENGYPHMKKYVETVKEEHKASD